MGFLLQGLAWETSPTLLRYLGFESCAINSSLFFVGAYFFASQATLRKLTG
jgi:hypothetical protein